MKKLYFISKMRSNAIIDDTMTGESIKLEGRNYYRLTRAPRGRKIFRRFLNSNESERIVIYS